MAEANDKTEAQRRQDAIEQIDDLFPPDETIHGRELLLQALCCGWRTLSVEVLEHLARLNQYEERRP